jgi:hypothetical protein
LPAELYEWVRCLFEEDDFRVSDMYPAIDQAFAEGWNDPKMSDFDHDEATALKRFPVHSKRAKY